MSRTAMTQAEMVAEVANTIGRDRTSYSADQSTTYEDRIKQYLFWSHLTIGRLYAFPELDQPATTTGLAIDDYTYTFTQLGLTDQRVRQILSVRLINGTSSTKLTQRLFRTFEEAHPYIEGDSARPPCEYTVYGRGLELWPKPDSTYSLKIRVNYYPTDFTSSTDTSVYINKDDVIIAGAVAHAYNALQENADAAVWAKIFAGRLQAAIGPDMDPQDWEPEGRAFDYGSGRPSFGHGEYHADPLVYFNP